MRGLGDLKVECEDAMRTRGHRPGAWHTFGLHGHFAANIECKTCGLDAQVIEKPASNEIDIGGRAVALNCSTSTTSISSEL